jgi:hypothetical protein
LYRAFLDWIEKPARAHRTISRGWWWVPRRN